MLDVSRINRGLIELKIQPQVLNPLIEQAVEASKPALAAAGHELTVRVVDPAAMVNVDPARLVQILTNLLNNAAKYTPPGGKIDLKSMVEGQAVVVEVTDNGVGIPEADIGRLFEMFSQLPHTLLRAQGGLGIGLALARRLVEMHGGTIVARSKGLGCGSTFRITLPAIDAMANAGEKQESGHSTKRRARILVVEDNDDGLEALLELLRSEGHAVVGASNGAEALASVDHRHLDIVLLDLGLPGMDGFEIAKQLRADVRLNGTKLVALTGWGAQRDRDRTCAAGFDAHLTKPVEPEKLLQLISEWTQE